jgi:ferrous iron transport protein A
VTLSELPVGGSALIESVGGERTFRRRLLELGLLPGTPVRLLRVAPLGDPLELWARGANLSIRRQDADRITITSARGSENP